MNDWIDHPNYNCQVTLRDGSQRRVYANWLHNQQMDRWQGWTCLSGARRLYIDKDLAVWNGECRNQQLGSIPEGFQLITHTRCEQPSCSGCTDDLMVAKHP